MIEEIYDLSLKVGQLTDEEKQAMEEIKEFLKKKRMISSALSPQLPSVKEYMKKRGRKRKDIL